MLLARYSRRLLKVGTADVLPALQCACRVDVPQGNMGILAGEGRENTEEQAQASTSGRDVLYPTHTPLSPLQKGAVAIFSSLAALANPARADLVAAVGETTGWAAFEGMRSRMLRSEEGRKILSERPRVTDATMAAAAKAGPGTFGAAYTEFMGSRGFSADERPPVRFVDDAELAYVAARAREVHDFWHVLFGCHTNVSGELALKAVEFIQTGMPMAALSVLGAQWRLNPRARHRLRYDFLPWAFRAGFRSTDLMCIYYERHFQDNLEELRARWRIIPAPAPLRKPGKLEIVEATVVTV